MAPPWGPLTTAAGAALAVLTATPCEAKNWQLVGPGDVPTDRIYVDQDSMRLVDGVRVASVMSIYATPRANKNNLVLDRSIQEVGLNCRNSSAVIIKSVAFLGDKAVGSSPETVNWSSRLLPVNAGASMRIMAAACAPPLADTAAGARPPAGTGTPGGAAPSPAGPAQTGSAPPAAMKVSSGSGVFLNSDGFLLTNVHVIAGCKVIVAKVVGANPVPATLEAADPKNDLAILRTARSYGTPVKFRPEQDPVRLGENVGVIGYPLSGILSSEPKATFGQVNSVAGMNNDYTLMQISAQVQPGNSGGPVVDDAGLVVGVVVSTASPKLAELTGSTPQNINFAIKAEIAQIFMTAHGVSFSVGERGWRLRTDEIAERGEKSTAQILCGKP